MHIYREACRIANCLDFIEKWDDGFDTVSLCALCALHPTYLALHPLNGCLSKIQLAGDWRKRSTVEWRAKSEIGLSQVVFCVHVHRLFIGGHIRLTSCTYSFTYRAMIRDSKILLLDEISAALDSVSEAALHSALENVLQVKEEKMSSFLTLSYPPRLTRCFIYVFSPPFTFRVERQYSLLTVTAP